MTQSSSDTCWHGAPLTAFDLRPVGDVFVVYDHRSGATNLLDMLAAAILRSLAGRKITLDQLRTDAAAHLDVDPEDIPLDRLRASCADLAAVDLIQPFPDGHRA